MEYEGRQIYLLIEKKCSNGMYLASLSVDGAPHMQTEAWGYTPEEAYAELRDLLLDLRSGIKLPEDLDLREITIESCNI